VAKLTLQPVLQFDPSCARELASRYQYEADEEVIAIGEQARDRGYYLRREFLTVCGWKTARSGPLVSQNTKEQVEAATRAGLTETASDRQRMRELCALTGVGMPTASVLLHLVHPNMYPIVDFRALEALGIPHPRGYSASFWLAFIDVWRELRVTCDVDGRAFDQALWQWSKEAASSRP
jgi:hypothetical protein